MAITRDGDELVFCCDRCPATLDTDHGELAQAWQKAYDKGWRGEIVNNKSRHVCPTCAQQIVPT